MSKYGKIIRCAVNYGTIAVACISLLIAVLGYPVKIINLHLFEIPTSLYLPLAVIIEIFCICRLITHFESDRLAKNELISLLSVLFFSLFTVVIQNKLSFDIGIYVFPISMLISLPFYISDHFLGKKIGDGNDGAHAKKAFVRTAAVFLISAAVFALVSLIISILSFTADEIYYMVIFRALPLPLCFIGILLCHFGKKTRLVGALTEYAVRFILLIPAAIIYATNSNPSSVSKLRFIFPVCFIAVGVIFFCDFSEKISKVRSKKAISKPKAEQ